MLYELRRVLLSTSFQLLLRQPQRWDSLVINRRKPHTYRIFTNFKDLRVCLHRFDKCDEHEAFRHPHPWPGAFRVMQGQYEMKLWLSKDRFDNEPQEVSTVIMKAGSSYEITNPLTWHSVVPYEETYTIMVNDNPWDKEIAHESVRTTKGKDLDSLSREDLEQHLSKFRDLMAEFYVKG